MSPIRTSDNQPLQHAVIVARTPCAPSVPQAFPHGHPATGGAAVPHETHCNTAPPDAGTRNLLFKMTYAATGGAFWRAKLGDEAGASGGIGTRGQILGKLSKGWGLWWLAKELMPGMEKEGRTGYCFGGDAVVSVMI